MKKILIMIAIGILLPVLSWSQTIKIIDQTTSQPLVGVILKADGKSAVTNLNGEADITSLKGSKAIEISHLNYTSKVYSFDELTNLQFTVRLTETSLSLNQIIVSANRYEESAKDVAQPVDVIRSSDMAYMNQPTTAEVIQNSGNVLVQKSQLGGGSPIIRGFETNKVLMVVDGVRMNNAIYRGGHIQNIITVDNNMLDKIEIVYGPGSVMYGSDALGGVMHFYSKNPILSDNGGVKVKANAFTRYSSASNEKTGHFDFSIGTAKFGSLTSFTYSSFGDLRQGYNRNSLYGDWGLRTFYAARVEGKDSMFTNQSWNLQVGSGYSQYDITQKFLFKQSDKVSHVLNFQYSTSSDLNRYDRLTQLSGGLPKYAEYFYGPQKRLFGSYTLNLTNDHGFYDNGRIIVGFQQIEESRNDRKFNKNFLNNRTENLNIFTFNADFAKKMGKHELRYGIDGWYNQVNSTAYSKNIVVDTIGKLDTRYPDGGSTMSSIAAYISHSFEISEKWILQDGIRVSDVMLSSKFIDTTYFPFPFNSVSQNNTAINGNIGLIFMPTDSWRFSVLGSTGFRVPNVDDMSKVFESTAGNIVVPNPDLKPEYTYNGDFGISKTFNNKATFGGTAFYTLLTNAITSQPGKFNGADSIMYEGQMSQVISSQNTDQAYIYGFNVYLKADVTEYFSITSTLNYTYGRIKTDTTDYPLDHVAPIFGKTSMNLRLKKFRGELYVMYSGAKKPNDYNLNGEDNQSNSIDPVHGYMPAWATINIRAAYQFTPNIQLQMSLENIGDTYYRVFSSNISAPGRNLIVTLRGNF